MLKSFVDVCQTFLKIILFFFSLETPCLCICVTNCLIAVENESRLLLAVATLNDSTPIAEETMLVVYYLTCVAF